MPADHEIRADFDRTSIVVYQAFNRAIAETAVRLQKFGPPFSLGRMTWIKPSFLWMMERSGYGTKANQEHVLAVRIRLEGWEQALRSAVLSSVVGGSAPVRVQWDPERNLRGGKLPWRSIQVGLSRSIAPLYVDAWTLEIRDLSDLVARIRKQRAAGEWEKAERLLPPERVWPAPADIRRRLDMTEPS